MEKEGLKKLTFIPIKILAILTAIIILTKFSFVFYDFLKNPFFDPAFIPREAVRHVMTALILIELLVLTLQFLVEDIINPNIIIIAVLTVIGRDIIVLDLQEIDYRNLLGISVLFAITIAGLYLLKFEKS